MFFQLKLSIFCSICAHSVHFSHVMQSINEASLFSLPRLGIQIALFTYWRLLHSTSNTSTRHKLTCESKHNSVSNRSTVAITSVRHTVRERECTNSSLLPHIYRIHLHLQRQQQQQQHTFGTKNQDTSSQSLRGGREG